MLIIWLFSSGVWVQSLVRGKAYSMGRRWRVRASVSQDPRDRSKPSGDQIIITMSLHQESCLYFNLQMRSWMLWPRGYGLWGSRSGLFGCGQGWFCRTHLNTHWVSHLLTGIYYLFIYESCS
jgi:hypothetical protein